jgi:uncharacterized protein YjdB
MHKIQLPRCYDAVARVSILALALTAISCSDSRQTLVSPRAPALSIVDGAHAGNPHFFWLAPMVKNPAVAGTFDAGVSPQIAICRWNGSSCEQPIVATFTTTSGPGSETVRVDAANSLYIVNWHTDQFALTLGGTYRIMASVLGGTVGSADVQVLANGAAKNVTTGDDIALVDGKTLPIKFRIEQGMVVSVAVTPNPTTIVVGKMGALAAVLTDANGNVVANQVVSWSSDNTAVATVDSHGVVTGVSLGTATITASSNGMSGAASVVVVRPPVAAVIVEPATSTVQVGQSETLVATLKDADGNTLTGRTVAWTSSDPTSATVDANGVVTGVQPNPITITATAEGVSGVAGVTVTPAGFSVKVGSLSGGDFHTCGITSDGKGYCWGENVWGEIGNGAVGGSQLQPNLVAGGLTWSRIEAASIGTCGLSTNGTVYCWGANNVNQLGDGFSFAQEPQRGTPGPVLSSLHFTQLANFNGAPCALDASSTAWCWGWNDNGRLGAGNVAPLAPIVGLGGNTWRFLAQGQSDNCGVTTAGVALCFGVIDGQVVGTSPVYTTMTVGHFHACGLDAAGSAWCSGANDQGQFGNGTTSASMHPAAVPAAMGMTFVAIASGINSVCGLTPAGDIYCWGNNDHGELGNGTMTSSTVPVKVSGSLTYTSLARGYFHFCATATDGGVYCWGNNQFGQLGDGTTQTRATPTRVVPAAP